MFARMKTKPTASPATAPVVNRLLTSNALAREAVADAVLLPKAITSSPLVA